MSKIVNGTTYHDSTPMVVVGILEGHRQHGRLSRIRLSFGDSKTGKDWLEEHDVEGYVGRSTGTSKIPLLIATRTSSGGPGILDHCIVRIKQASGGRVLWQHPKYNRPIFEIKDEGPKVAVLADGEVHARFRTRTEARKWLHKMS